MPQGHRLSELALLARNLEIDRMSFASLPDETYYLHKDLGQHLFSQGYRWAISLAKHLPRSVCDLLLYHDDQGAMLCFHHHCVGVSEQLEQAARRLVEQLDFWGYGAFVVPGGKRTYREGAPNLISHVALARMGGLGTIGDSGLLLTPEYGPRVRLTTVLTTLPLLSGKPMSESLCLHCGKCVEICPAQAVYGMAFDSSAPGRLLCEHKLCDHYRSNREQRLGTRFCNLCQAACPAGAPRKNAICE